MDVSTKMSFGNTQFKRQNISSPWDTFFIAIPIQPGKEIL